MTTIAPPRATRTPARRVGPIALGLRQGRLEIRQFLRSREAVVFTMLFPVVMILILWPCASAGSASSISRRSRILSILWSCTSQLWM